MAKKKNPVIESTTSAALQWHFSIVTEPPSDRVGKEYLAQHLPKHYQLEGDTLVHFLLLKHGFYIELRLDCQEDRAISCTQTASRKPSKS